MHYLTAVVPARDPEQAPYVATPIGPYRADETDAMERGRAFLRDAYATEDIRTVETPHDGQDFDTARSMVIQAVGAEWRERYEKARAAAVQDALDNMRPERWSIVVTADTSALRDDLDTLLEVLGVNPGDV